MMEIYDSYLCLYCNIWLEKEHSYGEKNRPNTPLPSETKRKILRLDNKNIS